MNSVDRKIFEALMKAPIEGERQNLRDAVPYAPKKLATLSRPFLTSTGWHAASKGWRGLQETKQAPSFPAWTNGTRMDPCRPFESGVSVLPGLEAWITVTKDRGQNQSVHLHMPKGSS